MKNYLSILPILLFTGSITFSQQYSIQQAIDYALQNNKNVLNASLDIEKSNQKIKETRAIGLPHVTAEGTFNDFIDIATTVAPANAFNPMASPDDFVELQFGTRYNASGSLTVSQLLFDGGYLVALKTTKKYQALSQIQKEKSQYDLKREVVNAYYGVLVSQESIQTLEDLVANSSAMYEKAKKTYDAGFIEKDNVDQLELSLINTTNALTSAKNRVEIAKKNLKFQMGLDLNAPLEVTSSFEEVVNSVKANGNVESFNPANNVDLKLLNAQLELNMLNVKYEKWVGLPQLSAFFSHQQQAFRNDFDFFENKPWYPTTLWGLKLSAPIYGFGQQAAVVKQAEIEVKKTENQIALVEEGLKLQQANALLTYQNALQSYEAQEKAVKTAKSIYDRHQIKYNEGMISSLELTQTQSQFINAQNGYIQSIYELINAKLELDQLNNKL